ncbi:M28 family peptidase [Flavobacteriaceae bacterium S356]|uniref:M28 family peptidase n=1 Tax=Asprobacillus argus TaxID=3076534 RepID=A0ABU3LI30_9FLAO|nr:M28 family peptidase [Flavobacteriaceae bacterium S356]
MKNFITLVTLILTTVTTAQTDKRVYDIVNEVSAERIKEDITTLANFGTRHTLSDTISQTRGIGAARRWIKSEFDKISSNCNNCLNVFYQKDLVKKDNRRIVHDVMVVNVVAVQKGTKYPNRYIIMSGDIDSRVSKSNDFTSDSPGANDNASGMAGAIEAARVLSKYTFENSIIYVGLSGEEQGLFGGRGLAAYAKEKGWEIIGILNNDMIGNIKGVDGVIDNRTFRIFSEPTTYDNHTERQRRMRRFYGGEVDGISRQLARFIYKSTKTYMPEMNPKMIYRLDRFGRGGHHRPFNDAGFAGVRIMEMHENYTQQHQDIRTENGIEYGDKIKFVNFDYAKKLTAVNAINLATIAWAPPAPKNVKIGGAVQPAVKLSWDKVDGAKGYKIYWRDTTSPTWDHYKYVENVNAFTLDGIVVDNFFFGVAAVGKDGHESLVTFPSGLIRR